MSTTSKESRLFRHRLRWELRRFPDLIVNAGIESATVDELLKVADQGLRQCRADAVFALPHPFGCSQLGDDLDDTRKILAALASHPNVGGVVLVALGCESNQVDELLKEA